MGVKPFVTACALAIGFCALGSGAAVAGEPDGSAAGKKAKDTSKRICKNVVHSGTRLSTRYCRSKADWDRDMDNTQDWVQQGKIDGSRRDGEFTTSGLGAPR